MPPGTAARFSLASLTGLILLPLHAAAPSFRNDVMAVISKAGCNAGTCHGNKNGKGDLRLSLRGQDPGQDHETLTRDAIGRRINALDPDQSLILLKPTSQVAHEGGRRFSNDSIEYQILLDWIRTGLPNDVASAPRLKELVVTPSDTILVEPESRIQLSVRAHFSDGATRDVTELTVYDVSSSLAKVTQGGLVERVGFGEAAILARYLDQQKPVRIAF
ncbi:MAG: hypothetical protein FD131_5189, partial [Rhodocyclaceae bacterium]